MAGLRPFLDFDCPPQLLNGSERLGRVSCLCSGEAAQPWQRQGPVGTLLQHMRTRRSLG